MSGEEILYTGNVSKKYFILNYISMILGIVTTIVGLFIVGNNEDAGVIVLGIGAALIVFGLVSLIDKLIYKKTAEFSITSSRCILKKSLVSITVSDIALDKCEGVIFKQNMVGRILNYGTLVATTGGHTQSFPAIDNPASFQNEMFRRMDEYKKGKTVI